MEQKNICAYYQGILKRDTTWFVVGALRNEDHVVFERALDKKQNLFEFFVPKDQETVFLHIMNYMQKNGYVLSLRKLPTNPLAVQSV